MATDIKKFLDQSGVSTLWSAIAKEVNKVNAKADNNAADITAMKTRVEALEAGTYDDSAIRALIKDNSDVIAILNGTGEGSVTDTASKQAALKVAEVVAGADTSYDTLKEIADWILNDTTGAASMANDIAALEALVGETAVAIQISNAINVALKVDGVDKYALATDLIALSTRVKTLEEAGYQTASDVSMAISAAIAALNLSTTYETKGAADQALIAAKAYTDAELARVQALSEAEIQAAINSASAE